MKWQVVKLMGFAILFSGVPVLVRVTEEWHDVGAAKLMVYTRGDWMILGISCLAYFGSNLISFFSTKWADYRAERKASIPLATETKPKDGSA